MRFWGQCEKHLQPPAANSPSTYLVLTPNSFLPIHDTEKSGPRPKTWRWVTLFWIRLSWVVTFLRSTQTMLRARRSPRKYSWSPTKCTSLSSWTRLVLCHTKEIIRINQRLCAPRGDSGDRPTKMRRGEMVLCCSLMQGRTGWMASWSYPCSCLPGEVPCCCTGWCWGQIALPAHGAALICTELGTATTRRGILIWKVHALHLALCYLYAVQHLPRMLFHAYHLWRQHASHPW